MAKDNKIVAKIILMIALVAVAIGWRIINHQYTIAPNLELVTTVSVIAAVTIGLQAAVIVPLATIILSDAIIGNSSIFVFTWTSFAIIGLGALLLRKLNNQPKKQIIYSVGFATISSLFFFVVTNFGVWTQGWYTMTWEGLVNCFAMAIPFYRTMLIGNIILVPTAISIWQLVRIRQASKSLVVDSTVR